MLLFQATLKTNAPDNKAPEQAAALPTYQQIYQSNKDKNFPKVIEDCTTRINANKQDAFSYFMRGLAYSQQDRTDEAIKDLNNALSINTTNGSLGGNAAAANKTLSGLYYNRGAAKYNAREFEKAVFDFRESLEHDPASVDACTFLGLCLRRGASEKENTKDYEGAIKGYKETSLTLGKALEMVNSAAGTNHTASELNNNEAAIYSLASAAGVELSVLRILVSDLSYSDSRLQILEKRASK